MEETYSFSEEPTADVLVKIATAPETEEEAALGESQFVEFGIEEVLVGDVSGTELIHRHVEETEQSSVYSWPQ